MPILSFAGYIRTGEEAFDRGISALAVTTIGSASYLLSASGQEGGLASFALDNATPNLSDLYLMSAQVAAGTGRPITSISTGAAQLLLTGQQQATGAELLSLQPDGALAFAGTLQGLPFGPVNWFAQTGESLVSAELGAASVTLAQWGGSSLASAPLTLQDTAQSHLASLSALAVGTLFGTDYLVTGSASEAGVSLFALSGATSELQSSFSAAAGLGLMCPTDIHLVELQGTGFVIVASAPELGSAGALSVFALGQNGALTPVDHILDTQDSRFGKVVALDTLEVQGQVYVAAAGGDGGVSLFQLSPDGQLVHRAAFAGTAEAPLLGVTDLALHLAGNQLQIFVSTGAGDGITLLSAPLGTPGSSQRGTAAADTLTGTQANDILAGGDGNDVLRGQNGDDLLLGGAGADTLIGGNGADLFIITAGGAGDLIEDFNPAEDRIDLSSWPFLYDPTALNIALSDRTATLTWRTETLTIRATEPLTHAALLNAIVLDINRSFTMPQQHLTGTSGADLLLGDWGTDTLLGGAGDDTLTGGAGSDSLNGGSGTDHAFLHGRFDTATLRFLSDDRLEINSSDGTDIFESIEVFHFEDITMTLEDIRATTTLETYGSNIGERIDGRDYTDIIFGEGGDDLLFGNGENDTLYGGTGNDRLQGGAGDDSLFGEAGNDTLEGGFGDDTLLGGADNDLLSGETGADLLRGDAGDDRLLGGAGNDTLTGETGNDTLDGGADNDSLTGGAGNDSLQGGIGDDRLFGEAGDDILTVISGQNLLEGGTGHDSLTGGLGRDTLLGDTGNDALDGGADSDSLAGGADHDTLTGGTGDDSLWGNDGQDRLWGGDGSDILSGGTGHDSLHGEEGHDTLFGEDGDDMLTGGAGADSLSGGNGADALTGGTGNDSLAGGADHDQLAGEDGEDYLTGDLGNDTLWGHVGDDTLWGGEGNDQLYGNAGQDELLGGAGRDTLRGGGADDSLSGEEDADVLRGQKGDDTLHAGAGNDVARGNKGNDLLFGEAGDDLIIGGGGADQLHGGSGNDTLKGGGGADTFVFRQGDATDVLRGFGKGADSLVIDELLWGVATTTSELLGSFATVTNRGVVFDFGNSDKIILAGFHDLWALSDDITMG
ncbi:calcium-binding protein [uncultured Lentibacter sp.]|uniref:calcium-binding protein n=1 Tax=uncultured Lentibacter sp. TaxID=1659309 RepID=UPI002603338D|nr:calcium-binding protein [uncultured Lentibacter sp.]